MDDGKKVTREELRVLLLDAFSDEEGITPLKGFKLALSGNPGFHKLFFSAKCSCGTAALLTVEVSEQKSLPQVEEVLPALAQRLRQQAHLFYNMPCETHKRMRLGPIATEKP